MKNFILSLILALFVTIPLSSQDKKLFVPLDLESLNNSADDILTDYKFHINKIVVRDLPDGSPYVFEEFMPGLIYSTKEKACL